MVKYWVHYDYSNHKLLKSPEYTTDDVSHPHDPRKYKEIAYNVCATHLNLEDRDEGMSKWV